MAPIDQPIIQLTALRKSYHTGAGEVQALADVDLTVRRGEFVAVSGPSGCGKTTLLSILGLLDSPSGGGYELAGRPVAGLSRAERATVRNRQIGFVFQAFNLIGDLTVYENVELPLTYRRLAADDRKMRVRAALDRVGMANRMLHFPAQLSGGQQQRVAVARAVVGDPAILLADEPTGNLDSVTGESVMSLLRDLHLSGSTICMVTHDERFQAYADRSIHLLDGRVVATSPIGAAQLP